MTESFREESEAGQVRPPVTERTTQVPNLIYSEDLIYQYFQKIGQIELLTKEDEAYLGAQLVAGREARQFFEDPDKFNEERVKAGLEPYILDEETTARLQTDIETSEQARKVFIESNARLVVSIAKRYQRRGLDLEDLIQEGNIGLIHAVELFDYKLGFKFSTYATWWIRQAITRSINNDSRTIRIPVHMHERINRVIRSRQRLTAELNREPTISELADENSATEDQIIEMLMMVQDTISLDLTFGEDDDLGLIDLIATDASDSHFGSPEGLALDIYELDSIISETDLTDREYEIIKLRFGLNGNNPHTLEEAGDKFGLTRERIRQIQKRAMYKLSRTAKSKTRNTR